MDQTEDAAVASLQPGRGQGEWARPASASVFSKMPPAFHLPPLLRSPRAVATDLPVVSCPPPGAVVGSHFACCLVRRESSAFLLVRT